LTLFDQSLPTQENKGWSLKRLWPFFMVFSATLSACLHGESAAESAFAVLYFEQENT
jgi:hypothetical protein